MRRLEEFFAQARLVTLTANERSAIGEVLREFSQENAVRQAEGVCPTNDMDSSFDHHLARAKQINLSDAERQNSFEHIRSFVSSHPVSAVGVSKMNISSLFVSLRFRPFIAAFSLVLLITGTTISYAAESALPGDFLYAVKVNINERVAEGLQSTPESLAQFRAERVTRRLREAEELLATGKLTMPARADIARTIEQNMSAVEQSVAVLSDTNPDRAAELGAHVETEIRGHRTVMLTRIDGHIAEGNAIADDMKKEEQRAVKVRQMAEAKIRIGSADVQETSTRSALANTIQKIQEARSDGYEFSNSLTEHAESKLVTAERTYAAAQARIAEGDFDTAAKLARQAQRRVREAKVILDADAEHGYQEMEAADAVAPVQEAMQMRAAKTATLSAPAALMTESMPAGSNEYGRERGKTDDNQMDGDIDIESLLLQED